LSFYNNFTLQLSNVIEDLDKDGVEDHFDSDDDGDGFSDELETTLGFDSTDRFDLPRRAIISSLDAQKVSANTYKLRARLEADGGVSTTLGFVFGTSMANMETVVEIGSLGENEELTHNVPGLLTGETYYYKPFAENVAGISWGSPVKFTVSSNNWWADAEVYQGNWRINWLGAFLPNENGWIYHLDYGWAYVESDQVDGLWMWLEELGWVWTNPESSPFLWSAQTSDWFYPIKANGKVRFFDYSSSSLSAE